MIRKKNAGFDIAYIDGYDPFVGIAGKGIDHTKDTRRFKNLNKTHILTHMFGGYDLTDMNNAQKKRYHRGLNPFQRPTKKALLPDAEPMVRLGSGRHDEDERESTILVPPPVPVEFADANCSNADEEDREKFFSAEEIASSSAVVERNRDELWDRFCKDCPVRDKCFDWAMKYEEWGIWAGTTEADRHAARPHDLAERGMKPLKRGTSGPLSWKDKLDYGTNRVKAGYVPYISTPPTPRAIYKKHASTQHGTTTSYRYGCRCEPCRQAQRDARRKP